MKKAHELVAAAKAQIREIDTAEAATTIKPGPILLIDVREPMEFAQGHLPGALNVPRGMVEFNVPGLPGAEDENAAILLYCKTSGRAALSAVALQALGYRNVRSIAGGFDKWLSEGRPVELPAMPSFE